MSKEILDRNTAVIEPPSDGSHLQSHDLIYCGNLPPWQGGIALSNGETAVNAYQDGTALCYGIMRAGFADTRNPIRMQMTHADIMKLWETHRIEDLQAWDKLENGHYMRHAYPSPRPVGVLSLVPQAQGDPSVSSRHVLSIRDAMLTQQTPEMTTAVFVPRLQDCLMLELLARVTVMLSFSAIVNYPNKGTHWWDESGDIDAEIRSVIETQPHGFSAQVTLPGQKVASVCCRVRGATLREQTAGNWMLVPDQAGAAVQIYLAVAMPLDGAGFAQKAEAQADQACALGKAGLLEGHRRDWHRFWAVNCLLLEDKFIEQLFYLEQYLLRGQHGGSHVYSGMNAWHLGTHPWHGDMHTNINVEMAWLPVFPLNRAELADSFADHFAGHIQDARAETARYWGTGGVSYPFASLGNLNPLHGGLWRYEMYVSAWVVQVFWERYRYTGDEEYLRNVCYPIQREVLAFYTAIMERRPDGTYGLPVGKPVESQRPADGSPFVKDALLELASLRQCLAAGIEAAEKLGVDPDLREKWRHILANLAPLPASKERGMFVAFRDADPDLPSDHPTLLGALYPSGLAMSPEETAYTRGAFDHILRISKRGMPGFPFKKILAWGDDLTYSWLAIAAARLGKRETVRAYLYDFLILLQLKKNGLFASRPSDVPTRDRKISIINTSGGFVQALTEMFMQSFDGLLRVFPATPAGYTAAFAGLRTVGNFTVAAAQAKGRLCYIRILSGSGNTLRLRNDWGKVAITCPDAQRIVTNDAVITLNTKPGGSYLLTPAIQQARKFSLGWDLPPRTSPRTWRGPQFLETLPTEQAWTITIGQSSAAMAAETAANAKTLSRKKGHNT